MRYYFLFLFFVYHQCVLCSIDTIEIRLKGNGEIIPIKKKSEIVIGYRDGNSNKVRQLIKLNKPVFNLGIPPCTFYSLKFVSGRFRVYVDSIPISREKNFIFEFGIDTAINESLYNYPDFADRLPRSHKYKYLRIIPQEGIPYTIFKFNEFRKRSKSRRILQHNNTSKSPAVPSVSAALGETTRNY